MKNIKKWDKYFYDVCQHISKNSKCLSRKIGSILVKDKTIIGSGYNGPPRGIPICNERWTGETQDKYLINKGLSLGIIRSRVLDDLTNIMEINNSWIDDKWVSLENIEKNKCPRQILKADSGEMLDICIAGHSERNTLINSARMGICTKGAKLYMNCGIPCTPCFIEIINAGIEEIIVTSNKDFYDKQTQYLIENSNVKIRVFSHL